jgi:hypothetical protein
MQKAILQSDVQSKSDKSPVTVADYGLLLNIPMYSCWLCAKPFIFPFRWQTVKFCSDDLKLLFSQ